MDKDSLFLRNLLGKRVRIVAVDEDDLPPLTLREVSSLGVVAEDSVGMHFYPWTEIVEISPARNGTVDWAPLSEVH
ncbi:MAG TPA: hypothetical protein VMT86_01920 [Bryobacteraceae bacterium]|nr:hypothetical protein [Bryobacteraceae bacterium]